MNFLYPLFLAGVAAVAVPIVLHMIRRLTRKRVTFSSLMFVRTTMPRLKNRGRLENIALLILRCIILCLLAFGFARPFFVRPAEEKPASAVPGKRIVLLMDTSASMRRADLWPRAVSEARSVLESVSRVDRLCVMSFDREPQTLIGFQQWDALNPATRASTAIEHISGLSPSWSATNLGSALVAAAEAIHADQDEDLIFSEIALVSDLQQGCLLDELQTYQWPKDVQLIVSPVAGKGTTNASMQLVTGDSLPYTVGDKSSLRVRISNSPDATKEHFKLNWVDLSRGQSDQQRQVDPASTWLSAETGVYVPAGHSTIVQLATPANVANGGNFILTGDDYDFDNILYVAPKLERHPFILYTGNENVNDPNGMLYYLQRCFGAAHALNARIISRSPDNLIDSDIATADLIVIAEKMEQEDLVSLRRYVEGGGTALLVLKSPQDAKMMAALAGIQSIECEEADVSKYMMLGRIEYESTCGELLTPFTDPRFGDFAKIAFWKYRRIGVTNLPPASVLAWFDNNDPAWLGIHIGKGTLVVFASGWQPSDSNLALSTKFVPLLYSILEYGGALAGQTQYFVGDYVPVSSLASRTSSLVNSESKSSFQIRKPDSSVWRSDIGQESFAQTDIPGVYDIESPPGSNLGGFAVNLSQKESQTAVMPLEELEMYGVSFKGDKQEQQYGRVGLDPPKGKFEISTGELEGKQKIWRWLFIALLAVSLIEMWTAGWVNRKNSNIAGEQK